MNKPFFVLMVLATGLLTGVFAERHYFSSALNKNTQTAIEHAEKHLNKQYTCPMHAEIVSTNEGVCPVCGMALVNIKQQTQDDDVSIVRIPSGVINNMGVRVALVEKKNLARKIETPGFIQQTRKDSYTILKAPAKGQIKKFYFTKGQWIEKGQPILDIELDDLVLVQKKHLELIANNEANKDSAGNEINSITTKKTHYLMSKAGMTNKQISHLEKTKITSPLVTLYASHQGEVKELRVGEGDTVKSNEFLLSLGGLLRVSVVANAFQRDASWIRPGYKVDIIMPHNTAKVWKGVVSSGATSINTNSQNIGVKLSFMAPDSAVKNGMYVVGHIYGEERENALAIPREAVIYSPHGNRVIVALGEGRFKPLTVETGIVSGNEVEIINGLEEGDTVVVSAQFLIDSESSLQASYRRMTAIN